jgi:hypothetical protein
MTSGMSFGEQAPTKPLSVCHAVLTCASRRYIFYIDVLGECGDDLIRAGNLGGWDSPKVAYTPVVETLLKRPLAFCDLYKATMQIMKIDGRGR